RGNPHAPPLNLSRWSRKTLVGRTAIAAQPSQVEHRDAAELDAQQPGALEAVQRFVGALARYGRQQADLFLAQLHEIAGLRIEIGVEQARQATCDAASASRARSWPRSIWLSAPKV